MALHDPMNYCSHCGAGVSLRIPNGDSVLRYVCDSCEAIHYQNPKVVAGCIPEWEDKIMLCRRAIEPRYGLWTLPAGFMENSETTDEAAARETREEANAAVVVTSLYSMFSLPHINQVYVLFRAKLVDTNYSPGTESLEVGLYKEHEIPWDQMAFPVIYETLRRYYEDLAKGEFKTHIGEIVRTSSKPFRYQITMLDDKD